MWREIGEVVDAVQAIVLAQGTYADITLRRYIL
jgi:hypothetical protein